MTKGQTTRKGQADGCQAAMPPPSRTAARTVTQGLRARAWWVIRNRCGTFTLPELISTVATAEDRDAASNLRKYLKALASAEILSVDKQRVPGTALTSNGHYRYRLVQDLGHEAPVWRQTRNEVFDPNSGNCYPVREAGHD